MRYLFYRMGRGLAGGFCMLLLISVLGCGHQDESGAVYISDENSRQESEEIAGIDTKWKNRGFSYKESPEIAEAYGKTVEFQEIRCSEFEEAEPEFAYFDKRSVTAYLRDTCYIIKSYEKQKGCCFLLEKRRSDVEEPEQLELTVEPEWMSAGYAVCMDVVAEKDIAVLFVQLEENRKGEERGYLLLHLDKEGKIISRIELLDAYREQGIERSDLVQGFWYCDEQGNTYILTDERRLLTVFDAEGRFVMVQDYRAGNNVTIEAAFHAPDGSLIFSLSDSEMGITRLAWLDLGKKQCKELASIGSPGLRQFTMQEDGQIYYSRGSRLYKWDVQTGIQEDIVNYLAVDIPNSTFEYVEHVSVTDQEELILYIVRQEKVEICVLSDKPQEDGQGITLVDFSGAAYVRSCAAGYSRSNPDIIIHCETGPEDREAFWTRTMAEFAAGKGPDMLCLWATDEHLRILYEKGVLADLDNLIPQEIRTQIFPGILESGSINGNLVGLGPEGMPFTVITSDKLWNQEQWTVGDIVDVVEKHPDLEGIYTLKDGTTNPEMNLSFMARNHMENSPFWDAGKGESYFGGTEFQRVLELARIYGEAPDFSDEVSTLIKEGRCIATCKDIYNSYFFVETLEEYGGECRFIGFPGQSGYTGYWNSVYLIVVNRETEYQEDIAGFLQYLLDYGNQRKITGATPVREDVVRQNVYWDEWSETWLYQSENESSYFTRPDGDSYIEEYVEFLRRLGPWDTSGGFLSDIIREEAESFFNGMRDAAQTARIIDNRAQLYLNEQNPVPGEN